MTAEIRSTFAGLWLTREIPAHAFRGDLRYSAGLIGALASAGCRLTVIGVRQPGSADPLRLAGQDDLSPALTLVALPAQTASKASSLLSMLPSDAYRTGTPMYRRALRQTLAERDYDFVVIDHICMGWAVAEIEDWAHRRGRQTPPLIYIAHNHEASAKRFAAKSVRTNPLMAAIIRFDALKTGWLENRVVADSALVTTITEDDRRRFLAAFPGKPIVLLPPGYSAPVRSHRVIDGTVPRRCIIFGSDGWVAKRHALLEFLKAADPIFARAGVGIDLVGNIQPAFGQMIAETYRSCRFIGRVDDPAPCFEQVRIGVCADQTHAGFKLKYLDYAFNRVPIAALASEISGMPLCPEQDMIIGADYIRLAFAIVERIDDFGALNRMQDTVFANFQGYFSWQRAGAEFFQALARLSGTSSRMSLSMPPALQPAG
jgi:hypothetical protein